MFKLGIFGNSPASMDFMNFGDGTALGREVSVHPTSAKLYSTKENSNPLHTGLLYTNVGLVVPELDFSEEYGTWLFGLGIRLDPSFSGLSMLTSALKPGSEIRLCKSDDPKDLIDGPDSRAYVPDTGYDIEQYRLRLYDATHVFMNGGTGEGKIFSISFW